MNISKKCLTFKEDLGWDVSGIKDLVPCENLFYPNAEVSKNWDVSNVRSMIPSEDISHLNNEYFDNWDVSGVKSMDPISIHKNVLFDKICKNLKSFFKLINLYS